MIRKLFGGAVALFALLCCSQAFAESQCVTAGLNSACGYDCKTSGLNAKCAKTPAGACISVGTEIECWDPPYRTRRKAECISSGLNMACGYDCKSSGLNVKCAQTPEGRCTVSGLDIHCWDPGSDDYEAPPARPAPRPAPAYRPAPAAAPRPAPPVGPQPDCIMVGLTRACGYDCKVAGLNAQCAQTPVGACIVVGTQILCWDPPYRTNRKAECISSGLNMACGYDCKASGLNVRCSPNPNGSCIVNGLQITCSD